MELQKRSQETKKYDTKARDIRFHMLPNSTNKDSSIPYSEGVGNKAGVRSKFGEGRYIDLSTFRRG